jgi:hypothetical protein
MLRDHVLQGQEVRKGVVTRTEVQAIIQGCGLRAESGANLQFGGVRWRLCGGC